MNTPCTRSMHTSSTNAITSKYITRPTAKRINDVLRTRPLKYCHRPSDREDRIEIRPNEDPRRPEYLPEASTPPSPLQIRPIRARTNSTRRPTMLRAPAAWPLRPKLYETHLLTAPCVMKRKRRNHPYKRRNYRPAYSENRSEYFTTS